MSKPMIPTARLEALHRALDRIRVAPAYQTGKWFVGPLNFAPEVLGKDVVAHYAEAGRWEWEQFLSPAAVGEWERRRYFDVI